jgi:hypothetical protein
MKEVYKYNEILESFHQEHLFEYHNWLIKASKMYSSSYESQNELSYDHIHISSLTSIEDGKYNIKENIHRDLWIKKDWESLYRGRIHNGFILLYRASFEMKFYDDECKWSNKTGIGYRNNFLYDIRAVDGDKKDNEFGFIEETSGLDIKMTVYESDIKRSDAEELKDSLKFQQIFRPELTLDEVNRQVENEKKERLESWKGFEDEIY